MELCITWTHTHVSKCPKKKYINTTIYLFFNEEFTLDIYKNWDCISKLTIIHKSKFDWLIESKKEYITFIYHACTGNSIYMFISQATGNWKRFQSSNTNSNSSYLTPMANSNNCLIHFATSTGFQNYSFITFLSWNHSSGGG